ncbi:MAG: helix-turn-helix domain-containing protein [Armatimonadia bacterium]|nr:helix-turn-helix domain-containing protein [Armatimonadia bacterium]
MSIGERLKIARHAARLSQRDLAEAAEVSAMAISKYERDLDMPSSGVLIRLARALDVKTEFFLRPVTVTVSAPAYRRRTSLPRKQERAIIAQIQEWLERYLDVESFFGGPPEFELPPDLNRRVTSLDEVERVAIELREGWDLGLAPIESLVEVLEDRGIKVGLIEGHQDFDSLTFWVDDTIPVIVVKHTDSQSPRVPGDRQRFNLSHELGHLVLEIAEGVDEEAAAYRFAGAFLVPEPVARFELGDRRQTLGLHELHLLKHKYGLSMQAWIYRAKNLGVLSESAATRLFREFRRKGWHRDEPGDQIPLEEPERMKRLVLRAMAEDLVSKSRVAELLGMPLAQFYQEEAEQHAGFPAAVHR